MRKSNKKVISIGLVLALCLTYASAASLPVQRFKQQKTNWCWAASCEMIGYYITGYDKSQPNIVSYIYGNTDDVGSGSISNVKKALAYTTSRSALVVGGATSQVHVKTEIDSGDPLYCSMGWDDGGGHGLVISGYTAYSVQLIDPWQSNATTYYPYNDLVNGTTIHSGTGYWRDTVYVN